MVNPGPEYPNEHWFVTVVHSWITSVRAKRRFGDDR